MRIPLSLLHRLRAGLVGLLSLGLALPFAPVAVAQTGAGTDDQLAAVTAQRRVIEELRTGLDPTEFDVGALGLELAFSDADEIIELLQRKVAYEVYRGVLRGANGTLLSGAGNALDQALLLGTLLSDAGYEIRVALGELDDADAMRLVERMFEPRAAREAPSKEETIERLAAAAGAPLTEVEAALAQLEPTALESTAGYQVADAARGEIVDALRAAGVQLGGDVTATLLAEAKEYAWVEYRFSSADEWESVHLPFGHQPAPTVEAQGHLGGTVPDELVHKLRVEVVIERKMGDEFSTAQLMAPWESPVANLVGKPLSVGNLPWGAGADATLLELGTELADVSFFVPMLNGKLAPGAQAFDTMGHVLPPDVASNPAAEFFQTTAGVMAEAVGVLGALGSSSEEEPEEVLALTAQWVDFVLIAPGGEETRHRRFVFDRLTPEARLEGGGALLDQSVLLEGILVEQRFMVFPGALSSAYVADAASQSALDLLTGLEAYAKSVAADPNAPTETVLAEAFGASEPVDHLHLLAAFDALGAEGGGVAYRAEPTIVNLHSAITPGAAPTVRSGVDIIHNARRFLTQREGAVVADAERTILAGTWETHLERAYVERGGQLASGSYSAFAAAAGRRVVAPGDVAALADVPLPPEALNAMTNDLERGYAVVLPTGADLGAAEFAWWRVRPGSGETLGMSASGRGSALTEYVTKENVIAATLITTVMGVPGLLYCLGVDDPVAKGECACNAITSAAIVGLAGFLVGLFFFATVSAEAVLIVNAVEIGAVSPVTAVPGLVPALTPGFCSWAAGGLPEVRASAAGESCWAA